MEAAQNLGELRKIPAKELNSPPGDTLLETIEYKEISTHPAMIVGRLDRKKLISQGQGHIHGIFKRIEIK